jgi:hypothetical protein
MTAEKGHADAVDGSDPCPGDAQEFGRGSDDQSDLEPGLRNQLPSSSEQKLTAYDVKARMKAADRERSRPLQHLVNVEAELHARSAALAKLSSPVAKQPDPYLLTHQLMRTVNTNYVAKSTAPKLRNDTVALYASLKSRDPVESILDRLMIAMTLSVMDCHARGAGTQNLKAIDISLRHAEKGTKVIIDLVKARRRRRSPKSVTVGKVNVKAGGQAIVGNVETRKRGSNET